MEVNNRRDRSCNWFNNLSVKVCSTNASDDLWLGREEKLFLPMNSMASDEKLRAKKTAKQNVSLGCDLFCHRSVVMSQPKWLHSWIGRKNTTSESVDTKIPLRKISIKKCWHNWRSKLNSMDCKHTFGFVQMTQNKNISNVPMRCSRFNRTIFEQWIARRSRIDSGHDEFTFLLLYIPFNSRRNIKAMNTKDWTLWEL